MISFEITDKVSTKMDALNSELASNMKHILDEMMESATGKEGDEKAPISKNIGMNQNKWLYKSGQQKEFWRYESGTGTHSVIANYSGLRGPIFDDEFDAWYEFSNLWNKYDRNSYLIDLAIRNDGEELTLMRDYAYYQETGIDVYASPKHAKHQGAVKKGLEIASNGEIPSALKKEMVKLLKTVFGEE